MSFVQYQYADETNSVAEVQNELAKSNGFSLKELAENRAGRISSVQMFKLLGAIFTPIAGPALAMVGWFIFLGGISLFADFLPSGRLLWILMKNYMWPLITITAGGTLVLVIALIQVADKLMQVVADLASGRCISAQGRVAASKGVDDGEGVQRLFGTKVETYAYALSGEHYRVDRDAYEALLPHSGSVFKLHFAPRSKVLLSIEPL